MARGTVHIGTSGWHYDHWVGPFYPDGMAGADFLGFYATHFQTVEINNTFYQLPAADTFASWRDATPEGFVFAPKASRYITHMKKLKDPAQSTTRFFAAIAVLGPKLGPVLFQMPPRWHVNADRLAAFVDALPKGHRHAFEFRDRSWFTDKVTDLLHQHNAALCAYDFNRWQSPASLTADFAYIRLHGPDGPYRGQYDERALSSWARRIADWRDGGTDVYCYFNNDEAGYAAEDAARLQDMVRGRQ